MSVLIEKLSDEKVPYYQVIITLEACHEPLEKLKYTTQELFRLLKDADMEGMDTNYNYVLDLLAAMIPDQVTYKEINKD